MNALIIDVSVEGGVEGGYWWVERKQNNFNKFFRPSMDFMTVLNKKKLYGNIKVIKTDTRNRNLE